MDSSISGKEEIWFLRVCHHVPHELYYSDYVVKSERVNLVTLDSNECAIVSVAWYTYRPVRAELIVHND